MLDIDNRVGPLVIGFYLQVIGDGTIYMPLYKVENLYSHYSVLPSSLEIEGRTMDMQTHEAYSEQVAQQLIEKAYIPLQGEVTFENIKMGMKDILKIQIREQLWNMRTMCISVVGQEISYFLRPH